MRTLPLLRAIKGSYYTGHVDGLMATIQPMHPGRVRDVFANLADETGRRFQDPTHDTRHVFVYARFVFGSMEANDTFSFVINQVGKTRRRTLPNNHLRTFLWSSTGDNPRTTSKASPVPDAHAPAPTNVMSSADPNCRDSVPRSCSDGSVVTRPGPCAGVSDRTSVSVPDARDPSDSLSSSSSDALSSRIVGRGQRPAHGRGFDLDGKRTTTPRTTSSTSLSSVRRADDSWDAPTPPEMWPILPRETNVPGDGARPP